MRTKVFTEQHCKMVDVPVMRNGKPTKRIKRQVEWYDVEVEYTEVTIEGYNYYSEPQKDYGYRSVKKEDGTNLKGLWKYGVSGQILREESIFMDNKGNIIKSKNGYDGPMGKASRAYLIRILH